MCSFFDHLWQLSQKILFFKYINIETDINISLLKKNHHEDTYKFESVLPSKEEIFKTTHLKDRDVVKKKKVEDTT